MQARKLSRTQRPLFAAAVFALVFFCGAPFASAAGISAPPNNLGLVGYWSFNEGTSTIAHDFSGNRNNGTLVNDATWTTGKQGSSVTFVAAQSQYVDGGPNLLAEPGAGSFTVSVWFKRSIASGVRPIVTKGNNSSNVSGWGIYMDSTNGVYVRVGTGSALNRASQTNPTQPAINTWHHVVLVVDKDNGVVRGYLDGTNSGWVAGGGGPTSDSISGFGTITSTSNLYAGTSPGLGAFFSGSVDDIRIYNRALSATEVSALYGTGAAKLAAPNDTGLLGYWKLDEGAGTIAHDASGNGNAGTFVGTPIWVSGKKGGGLDFNGTDQYIDTSLVLASGDGTVSTWFKARSQLSGSGTIRQFVQQGNGIGSGSLSFGMLLPAAGSAVRCTWTTDGTPATTSGTAYNDGKWHYAACVKTGSTLNLYVDGVLAGTGVSNANPNTNIRVQIGGSSLGASYKFNGSLDDVRIYSRALSATEIAALYGTGASKLNASSADLQQNSTLANGLVGLWTFDGPDLTDKIYDRSVSANHGYFVGGATSTAKTIGKLGQALTFDGTNKAVFLSGASFPALGNTFTFSAWIKVPDTAASYDILGQNIANSFGIRVQSGGSIAVYYPGVSVAVTNSGAITPNSWHLVVYSRSGPGGGQNAIYVDGVIQSLATNAGNNFIDNANTKWIGQRGNSTEFFKGSIDDVRLYNRALSAAEVLQLYNLGK